jgi:hypothetical protein
VFLASADTATALALRLVGVGQRTVTLAVEVAAPHVRIALPDVTCYRPALRRFCEEVERLRAGEAGAATLRSAQAGELELRVWVAPATGRETLGAELALRHSHGDWGQQERFDAVFALTPAALYAFATGLRAALHKRISDGLN